MRTPLPREARSPGELKVRSRAAAWARGWNDQRSAAIEVARDVAEQDRAADIVSPLDPSRRGWWSNYIVNGERRDAS